MSFSSVLDVRDIPPGGRHPKISETFVLMNDTLIGLERAVALRRRRAYGTPLFAGLGPLGLLAGLNTHPGHALMPVGGAFS